MLDALDTMHVLHSRCFFLSASAGVIKEFCALPLDLNQYDLGCCRYTKSAKSSYHRDFDFEHQQGGRSWQPFGEGKSVHEDFRQAHVCYVRDKCVVFARNCKFASLI